MADYALIHTATRVIRNVTSDPTDYPSLPTGLSLVLLPGPIDTAGGPWKLDGDNLKVAATQAEYRAAGFDEAYNDAQQAQLYVDFKTAAQAARTAWRAVSGAAGTPSAALIKAAAGAQDDFNTALAKVLKATLV